MRIRFTQRFMAALLGVAFATGVHAQTSAFTYQGQLSDNGSPAIGFYDLTFSVWNNASGPSQVGATLTNNAVPVTDGLFTVPLNFDAGVFDGSDRWMEISVATNGSSVVTSLSPRQFITSAPYAIRAANAASASSVDAANITGSLTFVQLPTTVVTNGASDISISGMFSGDGSGLTNLDSAQLTGPLSLQPSGVPVNVGHTNNGANAFGVAVSGNYAYLANFTDGLRVYDISDPALPINVGYINNGGEARGVAVSGNYAYLADFIFGLLIYDISNPALPINVGNSGGEALGVAVSGNYAFLADLGGGLRVFDISDPTNPVNVDNLNDASAAQRVAVSGNHAYLADFLDGLWVYDISDPTNGIKVGHIFSDGQGLDVAVSGNYAYLADGTAGLGVYDISDSTNPSNVVHIDNGGSASGVAVSGNYVFLANGGDGLRVYDISNPANPINISHIDNGGSASGVAVSGNYVFLANRGDGLRVYELPPNAIFTGSLTVSNTVIAAAFVGDGSGMTNVPGDNLGDHTATENLQLNGHWLSGDGGNQGVFVNNGGWVGIGTTTPAAQLDVQETGARVGSMVQRTDGKFLEAFAGLSFAGFGFDDTGYFSIGPVAAAGSNPSASNSFTVVSNGNVGIGTSNPTNKLHVIGDVSATAFITTSDRNAKRDFQPVSPTDVLLKVATLPITTWQFKTDRNGRHLGPMAQDFHAAFGLGSTDKGIATVDADGVALAAIQGLNQKLEQKETEITELKARLEKIEQLLNHKLNGGAR